VKDQLILLTLSGQGPLAAQELQHGGPATAFELPKHYDALKGRALARYLTAYTVASRNLLLVGNYLDIEQLYAPEIARYLRATGSPDFIGGFQHDVAATLSTLIDTYAAKYVTRKRTLAMLVLPDQNVAPRAVATPAPAGGTARREDFLDDGQAQLLSTAGPIESLARAPGLDRAERRRLANGLEVVVAKRGTLPIVEVRLVVRTDPEGGARVPPGLPLIALRSSSSALSNIHWGKSWMVGSRTFWNFDPDRVLLELRAASGNLADLLSDVSLWVDSLSADSKTFDHSRDALATRLAAARAHPIPRARTLLLKKLFPDRPYGRVPTPESVRAIELGQVKRWIDEELRPDRATLLVVGDVEPLGETWKRIESELGGWKKGGGPPAPEPAPPATKGGRSITLVDRPGATQAAIVVGLRRDEGAERDEAALAAFRWQMEFELQRRIRVQEGASYGVRVQPLRRALAEALLVTAAVDQAAAAHSLQRILGTVQSLAAEPPSPATARRARWQVARDYAFQFDTVGDVQDHLEESAFLGLAPDHWEKLSAAIASLTPERMQAAARSLGPGREVVVIVGDRKALGPQLQAAGYQVEAPPAP
jgi:zinc protease